MAMNGKKIMKPERIKRANPDDGCMEYKEKEVVEDTTKDSMSDEEKMQLLSNHSGLFRQIAQAIPGLKRFNLTEESKECMKRFLTFQYQTEHFANYYRKKEIRCNLLIQCEDEQQGKEFVGNLGRLLHKGESYIIDESEYMEGEDFNLEKVDEADVIIICGCKMKMMDNANYHDGSQRSEHQRKMKRYEKFWKLMKYMTEVYPAKLVAVIASEKVCKYTLQQDKELYSEAFAFHIKLDPYTGKQVAEMIVTKLCEVGYRMDENFLNRLDDYIANEMKASQCIGSQFVDKIVTKITAEFFTHPLTTFCLTEVHVPKRESKVKSPEEIFGELNRLVGLSNVKEEFSRLYQSAAMMQEHNVVSKIRNPLHMIFQGDPGTGKTTVAKKMSEMFYSMGLIATNKCVIASAHDCLSMYRNGSVDKVATLIENAMDGVLFIDEAYALASEGNANQAAIAMLLEAAEEMSDHLVIILAGYKEEMKQFMNMNPGIKERFPRIIDFPGYDISELMEIFQSMCTQENISLEKSAIPVLKEYLNSLRVQKDFANARTVRNVFGKLCMHAEWTPDGRRVIRKNHIRQIMPVCRTGTLDKMVGLLEVKEQINNLTQMTAYINAVKNLSHADNIPMNLNMLFEGNPGTGKTTVAKHIADELYSMKVLKSNRCLCLERKDLVGDHVGDTEKKTTEALAHGYGGVIFIDEAYSLTNVSGKDYGDKVIEIILTAMIEHRDDTAFIFAGYPKEMREFLDSNPGLSSRIQYRLTFEDYTAKELVQMFSDLCKNAGLKVRAKALEAFSSLAEFFKPMPHFGNGRFVDQVFQQTIAKRSKRNFKKDTLVITKEDIPTVKEMNAILTGKDSSYNPEEIDDHERLRTTYHELGHAVAMLATGYTPENITIRNQIDSYGHVTLPKIPGNLTEKQCQDFLVMYLSGRNAERMMFGDASSGCSQDYEMAKKLARNMVHKYAMGEIGVTSTKDFLMKADAGSVELLASYRDFIRDSASLLLEKQSMTGEELAELFRKYPVAA